MQCSTWAREARLIHKAACIAKEIRLRGLGFHSNGFNQPVIGVAVFSHRNRTIKSLAIAISSCDFRAEMHSLTAGILAIGSGDANR